MVDVLHRDQGCLFATWQNVLVAAWTIQSTGELARKLGQVTEAFVRSHPEGFSTVHVIARKPPLPTSEAREEFAALTKRYSKQLACVGTVLEGSGFWASAIRSVIVGVRLVSGQPFDMQIYSSIDELSEWLPRPHATKTGTRLEAAALSKALAEVRTQLD